MTEPLSPQDNDLADQDEWLDALRRRPRPGTKATTALEANGVRDALLAARGRQRESTETDRAELERLLFRLRREGLLKTTTDPSRRPLLSALAIAATLVLGVALTLPAGWWTRGDESEVLRGTASLQAIEADDVQGTVRALTGLLRKSGGSVATFDIGNGAIEVAATVPAGSIDDLGPQLALLRIKPPGRDGTLRVEIRPRRAAEAR